MPSLGPSTPSSTYVNLLQVDGGVSTSLKQVESGAGSGTPLYLSTTSLRFAVAPVASSGIKIAGSSDSQTFHLKASASLNLSRTLELPANPHPTGFGHLRSFSSDGTNLTSSWAGPAGALDEANLWTGRNQFRDAVLLGPTGSMAPTHSGQLVLSSGPSSSGRLAQHTAGPVLVVSVPSGNTSYQELLTRDGASRLTLANYQAWVYRAQVVAVGETGAIGAWEVQGRVVRGLGAGTVSGTSTISPIGSIPSGWDLTCSGDATQGGLVLQGKTDGAPASFAATVWSTQLGWTV